MVQPIRPDEIDQKDNIPEFVLVVFNELIAKNYRNGRAEIYQDDIVDELLRRSPEPLSRREIYDNHWLDIEDVYRASGWKVEYDSPAYNESYRAFFIFKKGK